MSFMVICLFVFAWCYAGIGIRFPGDVWRAVAPPVWRNAGGIRRLSLLPLHSLKFLFIYFFFGWEGNHKSEKKAC